MNRVFIHTARLLHSLISIGNWRTADFLHNRIKGAHLTMRRKLFGHKIPINLSRTPGHVRLYLIGEALIEDTQFLNPYPKPGMTVIDVGASIGYMSLYFCSRVGNKGLVLSIEPDPNNFEELVNCVGNLPQAKCFSYVVGSQDGQVAFVSDLNGHVGQIHELDTSIICRSVTLDNLVKELDIHPVHLIKIDVEGYETEVLKGMEGLMSSPEKPILYVEIHPRGMHGIADPMKTLDILKRHYRSFKVYRPYWSGISELPRHKRILRHLMPHPDIRRFSETSIESITENPDRVYQVICLPESRHRRSKA